MSKPLTFLCIATFFKGQDFLQACKKEGNKVYLLTRKKLENEAWPKAAIDDTFYIDSDANTAENLANLAKGLAWVMRSKKIDRIVALDDFDVEKAAYLREEFRILGMGQTTARHFRDKLAMRLKAAESGLRVPPFSPLFNDDEVNHYLKHVPAPWVVKPRGEASAVGIKKFHYAHDVWQTLHELGEERPNYLIEQFKPGDVYHVDSISADNKTVFTRVSQYLNTPFEVAHGGGVFLSHTVTYGGEDDKALQGFNANVLKAFGMQLGASHTEFIKSKEDGQFYFLETSCRVGGAHLAEMVEIASGINLWAEWAKVETATAKGVPYKVPKTRKDYAGILVSLSRFKHPDMTVFNAPEVAWKLDKDYHVGMIIRAKKKKVVLDLLNQYSAKVAEDFHAAMPVAEKSTH